MGRVLSRLVINALALLAAGILVPKFLLRFDTTAGHISIHNVVYILLVAAVFAAINTFIKPVAKALSLPLTLVALGLVSFIVNTVMMFLLVFVVGQIQSNPYAIRLADFPPTMSLDAIVTAVIGAIVVSVVSSVLAIVLPD